MPVFKSEDGWARLRANVKDRRGIRSSHMEHRPKAAFRAGKGRDSRTVQIPRHDVPEELEAVSVCGLCEVNGRCSGACLLI